MRKFQRAARSSRRRSLGSPRRHRDSRPTSVCRIYISVGGCSWYGMVNVALYSTIITKVSNALNTLVSGEKPGFQTLSKGLVVLLCSEVVRQRVPDHARRPTVVSRCRGTTISCCAAYLRRCLPTSQPFQPFSPDNPHLHV